MRGSSGPQVNMPPKPFDFVYQALAFLRVDVANVLNYRSIFSRLGRRCAAWSPPGTRGRQLRRKQTPERLARAASYCYAAPEQGDAPIGEIDRRSLVSLLMWSKSGKLGKMGGRNDDSAIADQSYER